jgi:hypothetical protein
MQGQEALSCRYFVTYSGVRLPLRLVNPIEEAELGFRNTFMRAYFDADGRLTACEKVVYGQVELSHRYTYDASGLLRRAVISADDEQRTLDFDAAGQLLGH